MGPCRRVWRDGAVHDGSSPSSIVLACRWSRKAAKNSKRTAPGSDAWSGPCQILFYDAEPEKRLADGSLLLRPHLLDITSRGIPSVRDKSVLPLGLRYAGAVDVEAVPFLWYIDSCTSQANKLENFAFRRCSSCQNML